ncbi:MAG: TIGR03619 family F420-dependent LLM class oxidoreductase [Deltaproteobacteria bacterium]|nr:TIGR03619 family F420-dependent LLM class oxidoreductase [Deltaproteobacteria bacterium]
MDFWQAIAYTELDQLTGFARLAEGLGFTGVTAGDHFITPARIDSPYPYTDDQKPWVRPDDPSPDPLILAGALAQVTTRLRFMVTVYILPMRDPIAAAKAISTTAALSNNRLVLGVGIGWMKEEFQAAGHDFHTRGRRCDEALEVVQKLLRGDMVEHHGEFYDFPPIQMCPVPTRPVPILIGGHSEAAFRRAARYDGWQGAHYDVDEIPPLIERFEKARVQAGRSDSPRQVVVAVNELSDTDQCKRLEDAGVTGVIFMPPTFRGVYASSLETKRQAMEETAERLIVPLNG